MKPHRSFSVLILTIILLASAGCSDDDEKENRPPVVNAGPDQKVVMENNQAIVHFVGSGTSDPDGDALSFRWDFDASNGDNSFDSDEKNPVHTYYVIGIYTVTLRVSDGKISLSDSMKVTVTKEPGNVKANIDTEDEVFDTVHEGETKTITFDGSGSSTKEGTIEEWDWDFNYTSADEFDVDASGEEVSHDFESGTHQVGLRVTNDTGAEDFKTIEVRMNYNMTYHEEDLGRGESKDYHFPLNSDRGYFLKVVLVSNNTDIDGYDLDIFLYFPNGTEANNTDEDDLSHEEIRYDRNGEYGKNLLALGEWKVTIENDSYPPLDTLEYHLYIDVVYFS